ncbi:MAG: hypothetical protein ACR2RV_25810 [Verrucomicrobiales bacterium]
MKVQARIATLAYLTLALHLVPAARAESLHVVDVGKLAFAPDQDGLEESLDRPRRYRGSMTLPNIGLRVPPGVDAFIAPRPLPDGGNRFLREPLKNLQVAVRLNGPGTVTGFLDVMDGSLGSGAQSFSFTLDPTSLEAASAEEFEALRGRHFARLASYAIPGRAWFNQQAGPGGAGGAAVRGDDNRRFDSELSRSFAMFSGGRAIAENLALDRELILGRQGDAGDVPLAEIDGISVRAIEWKDRLPAEPVVVDALATALPLDQHALFVPSVDQLFRLIDLIEQEGAPVIGTFDVRNPFRELPSRYMARLGLDEREIMAKLPIRSLAITGGDPFFPSGTDVAVLIEIEDVPERASYIEVLADLVARGAPEVSTLKLDSALAVSNSAVQIDRLKAVQSGAQPSLGASEEFQFFRHRYPLAAGGEESAFVFLSDSTIRRWVSPKFRIAASRRARAIAALGALTARKIAGGEVGDEYQALLGKVSNGDAGGLRSERFGSLRFITPISEMKFDTVTTSEKAAYEQWRRGYESGWARVFDPIAIRLRLAEGERGLDLTVLPLTIDSEYRQWLDIAGEAQLTPMARNPHPESRLFVSFAIDSQSASFSEFDTQLIDMLPGLKIRPLSWVGESLTVFLDDGFFWKAASHTGEFGMNVIGQLPIGLRVESRSSLKLALFMGALKGLAETSSPDLLSWETRKHGERSYVAVIGNGDDIGTEVTLYYAALPTALLLSLDEEILKRAIDREALAGDLDPATLPEAEHAYGKSSPQFLAMLAKASGGGGIGEMRRAESWRALPILNEWRQRKPEGDAGEFHQINFGEDIACPGGKGYRWNAEGMTVESVAYGFPTAPKDEAEPYPVLEEFNSIAAGMGFEEDGLRLWANLESLDQAPEPAPAQVSDGGVQLGTARGLTPNRPGSVFTYDWVLGDTKSSHIVEVLEPEEGAERVAKRSWIREGSEPEVLTTRETFDGGLKAIGGSSTGASSNTRYTKAILGLPETLVQGRAVIADYAFEMDVDGEVFKAIGEVTIRPAGLETVTVPAGTFEDCVRVEVTNRLAFRGNFSVTNETTWFKEGVGMVKAMARSGNEIRYGGELIEYRIPEE